MQILIIPDLYETEDVWKSTIRAFDDAGYTAYVHTYEAPRTEDTADIVDDLCMNLIDKTYVIGQGIGGRVAIQLAARHPHQLAGMQLQSTPALPVAGIRTFLRRVLRVVFTPFRILIPFTIRKRVVEFVRERMPTDKKKALRKRIADDNMETFFPKLNVPMLLLWGQKDKQVPPSVAEDIMELVECPIDLQIVAGAGTQLHISHPTVVAQTAITSIETMHEPK